VNRALVLYAHGSRDPQWAAPLERIRAQISAHVPDLAIEIAFLELQAPILKDVVSRVVKAGARTIQIMPMFLGQGGHLRRDVAERVAAVAAAHPDVKIMQLESLGESEVLLAAIAQTVAAQVAPPP
jgi:sirohydrochlorin cobaltochelatase